MNKSKPNNSDLAAIIQNNWFLLRIALKEAPFTTIHRLIGGAQHHLIVFFEHVYMISYIIECIEYKKPFANAAIFVISMFVFLFILCTFDNFVIEKIRPKSVERIKKRIRMELYEKARSMDLSCYDDPEFFNDYIWAMNNATERLDEIIDTLSGFLGAIAGITATGIYILTQNAPTIIIVLVSFFAAMFFDNKRRKLSFNLEKTLNPIFRKRDYTNRVFYLNDYAKEIRLSNVKEKLINDFIATERLIQNEYKKTNKKIAVLSFLSDYMSDYFVFNFVYLVYLMFITIVKKTIGYGTMFGLYRTVGNLRWAIRAFATTMPQFKEHSLYVEKIKVFLDYESTVKTADKARQMQSSVKAVEFKNVSFKYSENSIEVLKNISLTINAGEKIAIVGYNGAGKTTFVKMLMRLYDVSSGEILYDGINIKAYDINQYRSTFATLFQDYQIFAASAEENVVTGDEKIDKDKLMRTLEQSGIKDRVMNLNDGLQTQLTKEFADGADLSGGEKQKIAISRSLYKNGNIIILDEPSSALDPIAEYELNNTMLNLSRDKTIIFISHRLSTTKMADRIYMFENGSIVENGSHSELMRQNGKYAEMFLLQSEKYRR